jgi:hypothetical protein
MNDKKNLVRMANRIQDALTELKHCRYLELIRQLTSFTSHLQQLTAGSRKIETSLIKGWFSAAERCCKSVNNSLGEVQYLVPRIRPLAEKPQKEIPKLLILVDELEALGKEFGDVDFDKAENFISVETEPITLEDVYLGPFRIQLELNKIHELYQNSPYRVIALDPNPAATDETVTHPHVNSEKLCEGDGCATIRAAIEEGRICDFFTIVRSILNTYSPDSPYVALHDWDGSPCYDCGYTMNSEDSYFCQYCEHDYCCDCSAYCRHCEETVCLACSGLCSYCEETLCRSCVSGCQKCGELFCQSCLEDDVCPNCKEEKENEDERQETEIKECENTVQSETETTEVKLAS